MNWYYALKTHPRKESYVARALERAGADETYVPLLWEPKTVSRQAKRFKMEPRPAIPKIVFFCGEVPLPAIEEIRYNKGLARTGGVVWCVSVAQMRTFREGLAEDYFADGKWLPMTKEEKREFKRKQRAKNIVKSFGELVERQDELFGIDRESEAA